MVKFKRLARHRRLGAALLSAALLFAAAPSDLLAQTPPADQSQPASSYTAQSPEQLQQLVAPIALYPDSLVAAILPAATFPEQIVEADRWLQGNQGLAADDLARAVNQQPWDASVKALTAFPAVLGNMDQNLSWTSSLGKAYYNQPQDVMAAVQVLRQSAEAAGTLQGTPEEDVSTKGRTSTSSPRTRMSFTFPSTIPGPYTELPSTPGRGGMTTRAFGTPGPTSRSGSAVRSASSGAIPGAGTIGGATGAVTTCYFNHARYASRSFSFVNRGNFYRGPAAHGEFHLGTAGRFSAPPDRYSGNFRAARGYPVPHPEIGMRSGGFGRYARGGGTEELSHHGDTPASAAGDFGAVAELRGGGRSRQATAVAAAARLGPRRLTAGDARCSRAGARRAGECPAAGAAAPRRAAAAGAVHAPSTPRYGRERSHCRSDADANVGAGTSSG